MRNAHLIRVRIDEGEHGLFYATSPDLASLFLAETDKQALLSALPEAMRLIAEARSEAVFPLTGEGAVETDDEKPWVAIPAHVIVERDGIDA